ncbi:hypothetical protein [Vibrio hippocampi]|uniref:Uncharacterized protein n=1 Tax=Vibrio hippocampi TaxID=654686 RepID=A0ABM8ZND0_9VIBR|nr:hypothetical protein [Vibrio hippocampi]CAH0530085.1 hypothetical protein VHP8226_03813 [Vibrio hippocampi]
MRILLATLALFFTFGASALTTHSGLGQQNHFDALEQPATHASDDDWGFPDVFDDMESDSDDMDSDSDDMDSDSDAT